MATIITWAGVNYSIPAELEEDWSNLSSYLIAIAANAQTTVGQKMAVRVSTTATTAVATSDGVVQVNYAGAATVNLPAGVDKTIFYIADLSGIAATNNITINRNGANTILGGTSYVLNKNSQCIGLIFLSGNWYRFSESLPGAISAPTTTTLNGISAFADVNGDALLDLGVGTANQVLLTDGTTPVFGAITNAYIDNSAAIAYSKLNLATSIVNADISGSAAIAYSKLNLSTSIVDADISGSAAIAYSKLNLSTSIVDADIASGAAIARSKIASGTASHVVINDGSGNFSSEAALATSRGGTGLTTIGSAFQLLRVNVGATGLEFATVSGLGDVTGPVSSVTNGIVQFASTTGKAVKDLGVGAANQVLLTDGTTPVFGSITNAFIDAAAAVDYSKLAALTASRALVSDGSGFVSASAVTATELGFVSGLSSALQTQLNDKSSLSSGNTFAGSNIFSLAIAVRATTNQISLGTTNTVIINSPAPAASRVYTLPDAGADASFVLTAGTQTLAGAKTFSSLLTASAGVTISGGSAANNSIWSASNVLRNRGGTSGWAVDNTSGNAILSATDLGAWTLGSTGFTGNHNFIGGASVANVTSAPVNGVSLPSNFDITGFGWNTSQGSQSIFGRISLSGSYNGGNGDVRPALDIAVKSSQTGATPIVGVSIATGGAVTLGPAVTGLKHTVNGSIILGTDGGFSTGVILRASVNQTLIYGKSSGLAFINANDTVVNASITDAGSLTVGPTSGLTTRHVVQSGAVTDDVLRCINYAATASSANRVISAQYSADTDCTGGYFFTCFNSSTATVGRIEALSNTTTIFTGSSDARLKHNPSSFNGLDLVLQMQPREFEWKSNPGKRDKGFYAQELYEVYPEAVSVGKDDLTEDGSIQTPWGIDYGRLTPVLVQAIKELNAKVEAQAARIAELEAAP